MHKPVLLMEILDLLQIEDGKVYLDGTIGTGGHTEAILNKCPTTTVIGIDRDEQALKEVTKRLKKYIGKTLFLFHGNFKDFDNLKKDFPKGTPKDIINGAILDLGISSFQLDDKDRGFSFQKEGPLDMRMDLSLKTKASDLVNTLPENELTTLFFTYGEERHSKKIAQAIVRRRQQKPFQTTLDLSNLISSLSPLWTRSRIHPATRVFQALRIAVNDELKGLRDAFEKILRNLQVGGRLAIISFHSLEDREVKKSFYTFEHPCVCPREVAICLCHKKPIGRRITKKPLVPSSAEITSNPRSRSAKLRVIERVTL